MLPGKSKYWPEQLLIWKLARWGWETQGPTLAPFSTEVELPRLLKKAFDNFQVTASPAQVAANIVARERFELENQYRSVKLLLPL